MENASVDQAPVIVPASCPSGAQPPVLRIIVNQPRAQFACVAHVCGLLSCIGQPKYDDMFLINLITMNGIVLGIH